MDDLPEGGIVYAVTTPLPLFQWNGHPRQLHHAAPAAPNTAGAGPHATRDDHVADAQEEEAAVRDIRYRLDGAWIETVVEEEAVRGHDLKITYTRQGGRVPIVPTIGIVECPGEVRVRMEFDTDGR